MTGLLTSGQDAQIMRYIPKSKRHTIVLFPDQEASSQELVDLTACKDYIERHYQGA